MYDPLIRFIQGTLHTHYIILCYYAMDATFKIYVFRNNFLTQVRDKYLWHFENNKKKDRKIYSHRQVIFPKMGKLIILLHLASRSLKRTLCFFFLLSKRHIKLIYFFYRLTFTHSLKTLNKYFNAKLIFGRMGKITVEMFAKDIHSIEMR